MACPEQISLFRTIEMTSFALDDARLFLDTHPTCQEALDYFDRMQEKRDEALKEYTKRFGPINAYFVDIDNKWTWNKGPLPWEAGGC